MGTINQPGAVREQYKTADKLNTRISIHEKYSTNKLGFGNWLFSHYDFSHENRILELGCGTGEMWKTKLHMLDESMELTLTDFSENMVSVARLGRQTIKEILEKEMVDGVLNIPKEYGMFVCRKG